MLRGLLKFLFVIKTRLYISTVRQGTFCIVTGEYSQEQGFQLGSCVGLSTERFGSNPGPVVSKLGQFCLFHVASVH